MIKKLYLEDNLDKFMDYQLCYVNEIPETYSDYDEKSKALIETSAYKDYMNNRKKFFDKLMDERKKNDGYRWLNSADYDSYDRIHDPKYKFETKFKEYNTPDFINGYSHYLYFTNDLSKQWGDDWDDSPYQYNAEEPYDEETDVIKIPFKINEFQEKYIVYFPEDHEGSYSVDFINAGVIPWIWIGTRNYKTIQKGIYIMGGETLKIVIRLFNHVKLGL